MTLTPFPYFEMQKLYNLQGSDGFKAFIELKPTWRPEFAGFCLGYTPDTRLYIC